MFHQYVFFIFNPKLEEDDPILTFIFFISGLVNQPPTDNIPANFVNICEYDLPALKTPAQPQMWIGFQAPATLEAEDVRDEKVDGWAHRISALMCLNIVS